MILQALKGYYDRCKEDLAPEGFENKGIDYLIVIDSEGKFIGIDETGELIGKKEVAKKFIVPRSETRSGSKSYATAFLLWDHIGYVLGLAKKTDEKTPKQNATFKEKIFNLPDSIKQDEGVSAIVKFYQSSGDFNKAVERAKEIKCAERPIPPYVSFRLQSSPFEIIPNREAVKNFVVNNLSTNTFFDDDSGNAVVEGICLITGEHGKIKRTHGKTFISADANSLISFQKNCGYDSYGKEQGYNAPIIESTEFAYTTALNTLLKTPTQNMNIGGTKVLCWSEKATQFESDFRAIFSEPPKDDPSAGVFDVKSLFKSIENGAYVENEGTIKFYILGLSQGGGKRICVRFWKTGTVSEFAENIRQHFEDTAIIKPPPPREPVYYSLKQMLKYAAVLDDEKNIPPNIAGDFMRSILDGMPYPETLLQLVVRRVKSNPQDKKNGVIPERAALIKAYLNRYIRFHINQNEKELKMALDTGQTKDYQYGRLFAVLEKIQEEAGNTGIRERYYGAACGAPVTVFPTLMRLNKHHLAKVGKEKGTGRVIYFEQLIGEIVDHFGDFATHLNLHEQGKFAIGYYHQQRDLWTSKKDKENNLQGEKENG
ncbi:type I-C CRISPR-associated protein Cas8c/Csd1 [Spirochaetia bacterium]|nr:type I-C CRISPR-associated protein Cas8c/Csd1 [Spirochaetia bacterium]